jgi:hypothetical protein
MSFFAKVIGHVAKEFLVKRMSQSQAFRRGALKVHAQVEKTQESAKGFVDATAEYAY